MTTKTRIANKTAWAFDDMQRVLTEARKSIGPMHGFVESELTEADMNMDRRRAARVAPVGFASAKIARLLWTLDLIVADAAKGDYSPERYCIDEVLRNG